MVIQFNPWTKNYTAHDEVKSLKDLVHWCAEKDVLCHIIHDSIRIKIDERDIDTIRALETYASERGFVREY
jgi:hypothetical protein